MEENKQQQENNENVQVHVAPDLDYLYRDVFNIFVGAGDVVIEFGNVHRSIPNHASISNRIVLSVANAYNLQQTLQQALQSAQIKVQQALNEQQKRSESK